MQVVLAFLLICVVSAVVTADREAPQRRLPLLLLCLVVSGLLLSAKLI
jgi:hypothetical protein